MAFTKVVKQFIGLLVILSDLTASKYQGEVKNLHVDDQRGTVNPSVQSVPLQARTGRTAVSGRTPGTDGILASVQMTARD